MIRNAATQRAALCVVLHDVAPARWNGCIRVLRRLQALSRRHGVALPVTLLVVPCYHGVVATPPPYLWWLRRLARGGHELALHGWTHLDDGPAPRRWVERWLRRHYTAGEGEFAALDEGEARARLLEARAWAGEHGLAMRGFVPPAWLISRPGLDAVSNAGFDYTCTLSTLLALPGREALHAPAIVFSTRSGWRRMLSVWWNRWQGWRTRHAPVLRFDLHPDDADHPAVLRCWSRLLERALRERDPVCLSEAVARAREPGMHPATEGA